MRGCGLFFARRRTCCPLPLVALLGRGRELMPALVQVDDDRHRVLDLLFDGVERVLHSPDASARDRALRTWSRPHSHVVRTYARHAARPTQHSRTPTIPHQPHNRTKFARAPFLAHAQHRTRHPLYTASGSSLPCAVTTHRSHKTQHTQPLMTTGESLQESRFNSSHLRRERSSR